jgi:hypothetical protein
MRAIDLLMSGRFEEAGAVYGDRLARNPDDVASLSGLSSALMSLGRYDEAIPLKWHLDSLNRIENPDSPGQLLHLSCAYWCIKQHGRAIELSKELCVGILKKTISMAPDQAGGATFGLVLHYMGVTHEDAIATDCALSYLRELNFKYNKTPSLFRYPMQTVKQVLGEASFEDVLEAVSRRRSVPAALEVAETTRIVLSELGVAFFHDGVIRRSSGDQTGCMAQIRRVFDLGFHTEGIRWQLARYELEEGGR